MKVSLFSISVAVSAIFVTPFLAPVFETQAQAAEKDPEFQRKVDQKIALVKVWAKSPEFTKFFQKSTAEHESKYKDMTNAKWKALSVLDPLVKDLTKNEIALFLKAKKSEEATVSEAFLSRADGTKVGFLAKPTNWSHKGNPKHELPMSGKTWQGEVETDASSGSKQIQISVPVVEGSKVIGSFVVGFKITLL